MDVFLECKAGFIPNKIKTAPQKCLLFAFGIKHCSSELSGYQNDLESNVLKTHHRVHAWSFCSAWGRMGLSLCWFLLYPDFKARSSGTISWMNEWIGISEDRVRESIFRSVFRSFRWLIPSENTDLRHRLLNHDTLAIIWFNPLVLKMEECEVWEIK